MPGRSRHDQREEVTVMEVVPYLKLMVQKESSDVFFSTGTRVHLKIDGRLVPVGDAPLKSADVKALIYSVLNDRQIAEFESEWELNAGLSVAGLGRFRLNVFKQRGDVAMVVRYIKLGIPTIGDLNLPPILGELVMEPRGLVLVVGSTGSGKSTTLAAMIEHRNERKSGHILTIEDPIEYLFKHKKAVINQREVGLDTLSFHNALRNAMREAPDVIMIGEIRDLETMQAAVAYAETGHLCLSTLHANNANQALDRIKNFFPETAHKQLYTDLSLNLRGVVSQRLLRSQDGGRIPAVEVMVLSSYVAELILKGDTHGLKEAMEQSDTRGMQTFDQCLYELYRNGKITLEDALNNADSRNDLSLRIRLNENRGAG
jgi:twitching motility protein PilU